MSCYVEKGDIFPSPPAGGGSALSGALQVTCAPSVTVRLILHISISELFGSVPVRVKMDVELIYFHGHLNPLIQ